MVQSTNLIKALNGNFKNRVNLRVEVKSKLVAFPILPSSLNGLKGGFESCPISMHCNKAHYVFNLWVGKGLPIFTTHRITQGGIDVKPI